MELLKIILKKTIENLGRLANQGTREVDRIVLDIMVHKKVTVE